MKEDKDWLNLQYKEISNIYDSVIDSAKRLKAVLEFDAKRTRLEDLLQELKRALKYKEWRMYSKSYYRKEIKRVEKELKALDTSK